MLNQLIVFIAMLLLVFAPALVLADAEKSEDLVDKAWEFWAENNQTEAESHFREAIEADDQNTRAYIGLSLLQATQEKQLEAWQSYAKVVETEENYYPYIYAAWLMPQMRTNFHEPKSGVLAVVEELAKNGDPHGVLKAMANQELGEHYQSIKDLEKANRYYSAVNCIREWSLIGPFENISASGFDKIFPPELEFEPEKRYEGKQNIPVAWFEIDQAPSYQWINFRYHYAQYSSVFYGNNFVYSPSKQTVQIRVGTSGSLKIFLNDEEIFQYFDENNNDLDTYVVETELQKGWNRLLIKCGFSEINNCNFLTRITDAAGNPIEGLKVSTEKQDYPKKPGVAFKEVPNFAESYFRKQIELHPDYLENYVLLAESYLRNDKAVEAELVLLKMVERVPNCALPYIVLAEAYRRGEKYDEQTAMLEKIYRLDSNVAQIVSYKFDRALENENHEEAENLLSKLEGLRPGSEDVYLSRIKLYANMDLVDKMLAMVDSACAAYPQSWMFISMKANIAVRTKKDYSAAIELYSDYLNNRYESSAIQSLANTYLQSSRLDLWEETYQQVIDLNPMAPGYRYSLATTYFALQEYGKAERVLKQLLKICPNSSLYWSKLGEAYEALDKSVDAIHAYNRSLVFNSTGYDVREKLRELKGRKSVFNHFESADIEQLVADAPTADAYPEDNAIFLLSDARRVVYTRGASETIKEVLVRVFNNTGVDDFKEYWIEYNGNSETIVVEEAVTIKGDGSRVEADQNNNHIVFKTMEPGDFIYLKWRTKNYYSGSLSSHFWDTVYFNRFYPVKEIRYSLLVPQDRAFHHKAQNMENVPTIKETDEGRVYTWMLTDEPAVEYEYGMSVLDDYGKMLFISSIEDWEYLVRWYQDIAGTKSRSSYEVAAQVEALFEGKEHLSKKEKMRVIYNFITENIRYSSVSFRQSNFIPQEARDVLVNRIGDCKDVTALGIAMLAEVDIDANYVLINTRDEGLNRNIPPSIGFNHCIAGVETDEGIRYLDFTAYNYPMEAAPEADKEGFSLVIKPGITEPHYLDREPFMPNNVNRTTTIKVDPDLSIAVNTESERTGGLAAWVRYYYRDIGPQEREKEITASLTGDFPNAKLLNLEMENLDNVDLPVVSRTEFRVADYISEAGSFLIMSIPWSSKLETDEALSYENRQTEYTHWSWTDATTEEVTISLPEGFAPVELAESVNFESPVADYEVKYAYSAGTITAKRRMTYKKSVVTPADYQAFKKFYNKAVKEDNKQILLRGE